MPGIFVIVIGAYFVWMVTRVPLRHVGRVLRIHRALSDPSSTTGLQGEQRFEVKDTKADQLVVRLTVR